MRQMYANYSEVKPAHETYTKKEKKLEEMFKQMFHDSQKDFLVSFYGKRSGGCLYSWKLH